MAGSPDIRLDSSGDPATGLNVCFHIQSSSGAATICAGCGRSPDQCLSGISPGLTPKRIPHLRSPTVYPDLIATGAARPSITRSEAG